MKRLALFCLGLMTLDVPVPSPVSAQDAATDAPLTELSPPARNGRRGGVYVTGSTNPFSLGITNATGGTGGSYSSSAGAYTNTGASSGRLFQRSPNEQQWPGFDKLLAELKFRSPASASPGASANWQRSAGHHQSSSSRNRSDDQSEHRQGGECEQRRCECKCSSSGGSGSATAATGISPSGKPVDTSTSEDG